MANLIKINEIIGEVDKLNASLNETANKIKSIIELQKQANSDIGTVKGLTDANEKLNKVKTAQNEVEKQGESLLAQRNKLIVAQDEKLKELTKSTIKEQEAKKKYIADLKAEEDAYKKLNNQHKEALENAKKLAAQYGVNSKQAKEATKQANKYGNELEKIDASLGQNQRNVGNYFKDIVKGGLTTIGIATGITAAFNGIKSAIKTIAEFEQVMSKVKGISGATGEEFRQLQKDALRIGAATQYTAAQVGGLQLEFAKLGFTTPEILAATEATVQLATATGEDLAKSAETAATVVRAYGLNASETQRVVDVMASSFNKSALGLDNFSEGIKYVGPVAKAANVSIEETAALMSALADAGIKGSNAGTALRTILSQLDKTGKPLSKSLADLASKGLTLADAEDEVGRNAKTALLVLADNVPKIDELTTAYNNANGSAKEMAAIMEDNLISDTNKLSSAWDGFILALNSGNGVISKTGRFLVDLGIAFAEFLTEVNKSAAERQMDVMDERKRLVKKQLEVEAGLFEENLKTFGSFDKALQFQLKTIDDTIESYRNKAAKTTDARQKALYQYWEEVFMETRTQLKGHLLEQEQMKAESAEKEKEKRLKEAEDERNKLKAEWDKTRQAYYDTFRNLKLPRANIFEEWKLQDSEKKQLADDAKYLADKLFPTSEIEAKFTLTKRSIEEKMAELGMTIDDTPWTFWDKMLMIDEEKWKNIRDEFVNDISEFGNILFDLGQAQRDRELEGIRSTYNARIEAAEGNKELQERLAKELAIEEARIQREQAKSEQNQAIFNIAISTAEGIMRTIGNLGMPIAAPFIALQTMLGALQVAAVKAQPLPEIPGFFRGTEDAPAGLSWISEHGNELVELNDGSQYLAKGKQLVNFEGGEKVHTARETQQMLNNGIFADVMESDNDNVVYELQKLNTKLGNLKQLNVNFDQNGMNIYAKTAYSTTKYLNKKGRK